MPQYRNIIDPNVNSVDGLWVPAEFDVSEADSAGVDVVIQVELACVAATGKRLPFGFSRDKVSSRIALRVVDNSLVPITYRIDQSKSFKNISDIAATDSERLNTSSCPLI